MEKIFYRVLKDGRPVEAALVMSRRDAQEEADRLNRFAAVCMKPQNHTVGEVRWKPEESFWVERRPDGFSVNHYGKEIRVERRFGRWNLLEDGGIVLDLPNGAPYDFDVDDLNRDPYLAAHVCTKHPEMFDLGGYARLLLHLVKEGKLDTGRIELKEDNV